METQSGLTGHQKNRLMHGKPKRQGCIFLLGGQDVVFTITPGVSLNTSFGNIVYVKFCLILSLFVFIFRKLD